MPDRPSDVRKKLDELYHQTEDIRHNLIAIHHMLTNSGFFEPQRQQYQPKTAYVPPPPVVQQVVQNVAPPAVEPVQLVTPKPEQKFTPPQQPKTASPRNAEADKGFFERQPDLEKFIGERLVTFIGIAVLVTGIAFFVKYAIDQNWINETGRTAIGILCGGILIGVAHRLRKSYTTFSSVLVGGGISVLYFTISYAFQVYHLFSQPVALGLLVVVTLFTVLLSVAYDRKELAILAIIGGFASPLMVNTGAGNFAVLCAYMLVLDIGMLVLAYYKKWNVVNVLAFLFTILFYTAALQKDIIAHPHENDNVALIYATLFYIVFFSMNIINNLKARRKFESFEIIALLSNTGLYYGAGYFLLHHMNMPHMTGLFTLLVAVFNFTFAYALFRRQEVDRNLVYFLVGIVITFVSLAGPVQLNGNHITLFWAAESVLLLWLYRKSNLGIIKTFSMILNVVLVLSVLYNWMNVYIVAGADLTLMVNKGFITTIGGVVSLGLSALMLYNSKEEFILNTRMKEEYRKLLSVVAMIMLFIGGFFEMNHQLDIAGYNSAAMAIFNSVYVTLFLIASWISVKVLRMEFFRWTLRIAAVGIMILTVGIPHLAIADVRNAWLYGSQDMFMPFMLHYVYAIALLAIGGIMLRDAMKNPEVNTSYRNFFLWLFCIVTVFVLSAELDNSMVMAYSYNPANPLWKADAVAGTISDGLSMSHKVGFPIIWGICSFVMMAIGMKKKNRQVRIISLVLFFIIVVKLILLGVYGESQTGKIVAFILCGVILLLVSFMYQKLKKFIMDDASTNNEMSNEKAA